MEKGYLVPRPEFQRRLVWSQRHKTAFVQTVLEGFPFPEIYVAAGNVNVDTGEGTELLVDGQQRLTTLAQYFRGSAELRLPRDVPAYVDLDDHQKRDFLEYEVVVRDLGALSIDEIKSVFRRLNSTNYALNSMEIHNARFAGAFMSFGLELAEQPFWENRRVFSMNDVRRMQDVRYCLNLTATLMSTYFNRDSELESYLLRYNDDFADAGVLSERFEAVFHILEQLELPETCRAWKKVDLFTLIAEVDRAIRESRLLDLDTVRARLLSFYDAVDTNSLWEGCDAAKHYYKAAIQATNDRSSRISRGAGISAVLTGVEWKAPASEAAD